MKWLPTRNWFANGYNAYLSTSISVNTIKVMFNTGRYLLILLMVTKKLSTVDYDILQVPVGIIRINNPP